MNFTSIAFSALGIVLTAASYVSAAPGGAQTPLSQTSASVPEPLSGLAIGVGLLGVWLLRRR